MTEKPKNKSKKKVVKIGNSVKKVEVSFQKTKRKGTIKNAKKIKVPRDAVNVVIKKVSKRKSKPKSAKPKATATPKTVTPTPKKRVRKVVKHNRVPSKKKAKSTARSRARYRELKKLSGL